MLLPLGFISQGGGAGGGAGAFELISTQLISSSTSSLSFSSIPSSYKHLELRVVGRQDSAYYGSPVYLRFNGDSASNYSRHWLRGNGSSVSASGDTSLSVADIGLMADATMAANVFASSIVSILDYANTAKHKTVRTLSGYADGTYKDIELMSALWRSTSAISNIDVIFGGNIVSGSRFSLYGVKG